MNKSGEPIDPDFPEAGTRFDANRDEFTIYQAAMLWTGAEPAEDGFFRNEIGARLRLPQYAENRDVYLALIADIERGKFLTIPRRTASGEVDGYTTLLSRTALQKWSQEQGSVPEFLQCNAVPADPCQLSVAEPKHQRPLAPLQEAQTPNAVRRISTKIPRRDALTPVIEQAQSQCLDPRDVSQVWPKMQILADAETGPFLASTPQGLKYRERGEDHFFKRDALAKRINRQGPVTAAKRR